MLTFCTPHHVYPSSINAWRLLHFQTEADGLHLIMQACANTTFAVNRGVFYSFSQWSHLAWLEGHSIMDKPQTVYFYCLHTYAWAFIINREIGVKVSFKFSAYNYWYTGPSIHQDELPKHTMTFHWPPLIGMSFCFCVALGSWWPASPEEVLVC